MNTKFTIHIWRLNMNLDRIRILSKYYYLFSILMLSITIENIAFNVLYWIDFILLYYHIAHSLCSGLWLGVILFSGLKALPKHLRAHPSGSVGWRGGCAFDIWSMRLDFSYKRCCLLQLNQAKARSDFFSSVTGSGAAAQHWLSLLTGRSPNKFGLDETSAVLVPKNWLALDPGHRHLGGSF